jgi:very-short-patch-repair endonuclease
LSSKKFLGLKFRRQHGIGPYIADFYCDTYKLIVELDGAIHDRVEVAEYDRERQAFLEDNDYFVMRFSNAEVEQDPSKVLNQIEAMLPSIYGGGGEANT